MEEISIDKSEPKMGGGTDEDFAILKKFLRRVGKEMDDFEFDQSDMVDVATVLSLMVIKSPIYAAVGSVLEILNEFGCKDDYGLAHHYIRNLALIASDSDVWHLKGLAKVDAWYGEDEPRGLTLPLYDLE